MKQIFACFLILILHLFFSGQSICEEGDDSNCGVVYGDKHSFGICAPKGWILDNKSGVSQGLHAVFYPLEDTWQNSNVIMYMNWASKDEAIKNIEDLVQFNLASLKKKGSPNSKAKFIKKIISDDKKEGQLWQYTGDQWGNFEQLCYFEEENGIAIAVLSSRNKKDFESSKEAFIQLVKSYLFLTENVKY